MERDRHGRIQMHHERTIKTPWTIEDFRSYSIQDKSRGISLQPFEVTPAKIARQIAWETKGSINKYLDSNGVVKSRKEIRQFYEKYLNNKKNAFFDIVLGNGKSVGVIGLENINWAKKNASFYIINGEKKYQRQGIGTKATELLLTYAKLRGFEFVWAFVFTENEASVRLVKPFSYFVEESTQKGTRDHVYFHIDLKEWKSPLEVLVKKPTSLTSRGGEI